MDQRAAGDHISAKLYICYKYGEMLASYTLTFIVDEIHLAKRT